MEFFNKYFHIIVLYFPIGVVGLWRWSIWTMKKVVSLKYKPIEPNGYMDTLSIITPVYNEDEKLFVRAIKSWEKNKPEEIIAVIDCTDTACIKIFKKFQKKHKNYKLIITKRPGKREALSDGIRKAKYNIIALVDSDTVWGKNIKPALMAPFKDNRVGGVGPRQDVLKIDTLARMLFNIHIDHRYFDEMTYLATVANSLTCISGRTAVYRATAIKSLIDDLENETFFGKKCISGDDKCLTRLVQENGWIVRYQRNALVLTPGAPDLLTYIKQQMRWSRNTYRSDIITLMSGWVWKREKFLAFHMVDRFTQPFTLILGPIYLILSIIWGQWIMVFILLAWWHLSRGVKLYPHLKHRPSDILLLPIYILTTYILAVLKIYAIITINEQGWITRWDKSRMQSGLHKILKWSKTALSYIATVFVVGIIFFVIAKYAMIVMPIDQKMKKNTVLTDALVPIDTPNINNKKYEQDILNVLKNNRFGYYSVRKGDTLQKIANKYNSNINIIIEANKKNIPNPNKLKIAQQIVIPIEELRKPIDKKELTSRKYALIVFDEQSNIIHIEGEGSVVTIPEIYNKLKDNHILEKLGNKEWLLKANLLIEKNVTLVINGNEVEWLKMESDKHNYVWIKSERGSILVSNTKITSWDKTIAEPDTNYYDGRSYILAKLSGRMDILNSEVAFLGHPLNYKGKLIGTAPSPGGVYGVSWRVSTGTFKENLITGVVLNNKFHNNYFGVYTFGATGMIFRQNEFYNNVQYGFDPHDDSNNLLIEKNVAHNNGNHGMIISKRCFNNIFKNNISYNNKLHGIMLDRKSNNNLVENNILYGNVDGVAIYDSHNNLIRNNKIKNNKNSGIRANENSSKNYIEDNIIANNKNGIFFYDNANNNYAISNFIKDNNIGIYIKNSTKNLIGGNEKNNYNKKSIKLREADGNFIKKTQ